MLPQKGWWVSSIGNVSIRRFILKSSTATSHSVSMMSLSFKLKMIKPKGTVQELKLVHSINCHGAHSIKTEEVKRSKENHPQLNIATLALLSNIQSRRPLTINPFYLYLRALTCSKKTTDPDISSSIIIKDNAWSFAGPKWLFETVFVPWEVISGPHSQPRNSPIRCTCITCGNLEAQFCCLDCYGPHWWCKSCLIKSHTHHPFHRPQHWRDGSFENVALCDLGYILILGHSSSGHCCPEEGNMFGDQRMMVIHVNGVFELCVWFCWCQGASLEHEQLFYHWLFSSSFDWPGTALTLDVLDYYGIDAMECKTLAELFPEIKESHKQSFSRWGAGELNFQLQSSR